MPLRILHYSDVETGFDDPDRAGRLAGAIRERREEETLVVGTGDVLAPGVLPLITAGRHVIDFREAAGTDVAVPGNHDFDHGADALLSVVAVSPGRWVCANVRQGGDRFGTDAGVATRTVLQCGDCDVGVTGVTHPGTGTMNPEASHLEFGDPLAAAREQVAALHDRGVEHVVVLAHLGQGDVDAAGGASGRDLAAALDVDAVLDGHRSEPVATTVEGTVYARPGSTGSRVVEATVGEEATPHLHEVATAPVDADVVHALARRRRAAGLDEVLDDVPDPIRCDRRSTHGGESRVGNLVTDAYRWATGADVAVHAPGGIREGSDLHGEVTTRDLMGLVPFDDDLVRLSVPGDVLRATLRHLSVAHRPDRRRVDFGHVSGGTVVWDDDAGELLRATVGGRPLRNRRQYSLATSAYYVASDHIFPSLTESAVADRYGPQYEAIVDYARSEGIDPDLEGRIERPEFEE